MQAKDNFSTKVSIPSPALQSQVIDFLRFPLIVLIVFYHNSDTALQIGDVLYDGSDTNMPVFHWCTQIFKVPLAFRNQFFFFISGYLFFQNVKKFDKLSYKNKIQNRVRTLFVPYLFWNCIVIALYVIISMIPQLNNIMNTEIHGHNFFRYFWNQPVELKSGFELEGIQLGYPINYQFWYVRDLMIAVLLTPILYFFCNKTRIYGILLLGILWYFDWWIPIDGFNSVCIFFFTTGAYFGINKKNLIEDFGKMRNLSFVLYPVLAIVDLLTVKNNFHIYVHRAVIIMGIVCCFNFATYLFEKKVIKPTKFLSSASFFLFAIHIPFLLTAIRKVSFMIFRPESDMAFTTLFFVNVFLTALSALGLYYVLRRFLPGFTRVITGGR